MAESVDFELLNLPKQIAIAKLLITNAQLEEAQNLLIILQSQFPDSLDIMFLRAEIAMRKLDYRKAINYYHQMLDRDPSLVRVRLELARAFFLINDDDNAVYHFRLILGSKPDRRVVEKIEAFLETIKKRRRWSFDASISIAPDSNINQASTIQTIEIFGLPFQLSDNARKKSGIGLFTTAGSEYNLPVQHDLFIKARAYIQRSQYSDSQFNDTYGTFASGPRLLFNRGEVSILSFANYRWLGSSPYSHTIGGRIEISYLAAPRLYFSIASEMGELTYPGSHKYHGLETTTDMVMTYSINSVSFARAILGFSTESTSLLLLRHQAKRYGFGYYIEAPFGINFYAQPIISSTNYSELNPFFNRKRKDISYQFTGTLTKKNWRFWGFAPQLTYLYEHNNSNIDLYRYNRHQFQVGLTRQF